MKVTVLIDSSGWIEYFGNGPKAKKFVPHVENAKKTTTITPVIILFEVYRKMKLSYDEPKANEAIAYIIDNTSVISINERIAVHAADLSLKTGLHMADSIIKATADVYNAKIVTSDNHFKSLPNTEII